MNNYEEEKHRIELEIDELKFELRLKRVDGKSAMFDYRIKVLEAELKGLIKGYQITLEELQYVK